MNRFILDKNNLFSYMDSRIFRKQCKMEKRSGIIVVDGVDYHVANNGKYVDNQPFIEDLVSSFSVDMVFNPI